MTNETERQIDEFRKKLDDLWDRMSPADFRRIHAKFFGAVISVETGFKRRFPEEWEVYEKEFYGEIDGQ